MIDSHRVAMSQGIPVTIFCSGYKYFFDSNGRIFSQIFDL